MERFIELLKAHMTGLLETEEQVEFEALMQQDEDLAVLFQSLFERKAEHLPTDHIGIEKAFAAQLIKMEALQ